MAIPYSKFLLYRRVRGDTRDEANGWLQKLCLPLCSLQEWAEIEDQFNALYIPRGYRNIYRKYAKGNIPKGAIEFLKFHGFDKMFVIEEKIKNYLKEEDYGAMDGAFCIHKQPFVRLAINVLLIHRINHKEIVELLKAGHKYETSEKSLFLYEEFFWNCKAMVGEDWNAILPKFQYKEAEILYAGLTNKLEDVKYLLRVPTTVEYTEFLKNALKTANYKFNYYSNLNTPEADRVARSWASTGMISGEKYEKFKSGDSGNIFEDFQMEFEFDQSQIPTADEDLAKSIVTDHEIKKDNDDQGTGDELKITGSYDPEV